jgi:ribose 5-phosphate isomerase A
MTKDKEAILLMKQKCAQEAVKKVQNDMILGIGSGSTVKEFIKLLGERDDLDVTTIVCIASSYDTEQMLIDNGMQVGLLNQYSKIDLTIDGADRVDKKLNLIKGGGAALLREKIIATAAQKVIIIVDKSKIVQQLDDSFPVPVEVIPFALNFVTRKLELLEGKPVIRKTSNKLGPLITDNGNMILDTYFDAIDHPDRLEQLINNIPGVMENGLFPSKLITEVIQAKEKEVVIIKNNGKE